jgi:molybdenum cofactor biosynthesis enzyme MoaA
MNDFYCVAPFRQVYIDSTGTSPCCQIPRQPVSLQNWSSSSFLQNLQQEFSQQKIPSACNSCHQQEIAYGTSLRTQSNQDYDQSYYDTKIDFVDYRADNLCNFQCRSCSPAFSHLIAKEAQDNPEVLKQFFVLPRQKYVSVDTDNYQWIIDNLHQIKRLMFTGGEPTVMPQVKLMLEQAIKKQHKDLSIMITTNGSFQDDFWYDLTRSMNNLHWTISIDAVESAAAIVRYGSDWNQVKHNACWLSKHASSFMVNSVVTNINVFQLWPLLSFVKTLQQQSNGRNGCDHGFHVSQRSYHLAADNLDDQLREKALVYLDKCMQESWSPSQQLMLQGLVTQLKNSTFDPVLWKKSQTYNQELDRLRGQNHSQLFIEQYPG